MYQFQFFLDNQVTPGNNS